MQKDEEFNPDPFDVKLKWIDGACYRIYDRKVGTGEEIPEHKKLKPYCEFDDEEEFEAGDFERCTNPKDALAAVDIKQNDDGRYRSTISVPQKFFAYLIGTKASRKKQLENETKTEITIPRAQNDKNVVITGPTASNVVSARRRIELISFDLREKHAITHFISLPLISDEIKKNFTEFKNLVLNDESVTDVDETVFTNIDKVHLTIGVLILLDQEEVDEAAKILSKMKEEIVDPFILQTGPITLHVKGLQYMNDDPSHVDVLYAKIHVDGQETNHQIQQLSNDIVDYFHKNGLMKKENDKVKLHATLMNTRYRRERSPMRKGKRPKRTSFDAKSILEKYGDFEFGKQELKSIHLSDRSSTDKNGYYGCKANIVVGAS